ncbi:AEC family transporter [Desulfovibrio inopinatus]|uniref:AEC family transporter n=1 Tax=Desulfovibrio inopinatus TaxID=102109 RepID=UPI0004807FC4|nr:AEC family transporter [Desulfovibrio inopinatus]
MTHFISMFLLVCPIFLTMAVGYTIFRVGLVDDAFVSQLNRLFYLVFLPLLLFDKIGHADFSVDFNIDLITGMTILFFLSLALTMTIGTFMGASPSKHGAFVQASIRGNMAYIGLAVVASVYGNEGLAAAGVLLGFLVPLLNGLCIFALLWPRRKVGNLSAMQCLRQIFSNPLIVAAAAGMVVSLSGFGIPRIIGETLHILSGMTLPLALVAIGAAFKPAEFRGAISFAMTATTFKLLVLPGLAYLILNAMHITGVNIGVGVILAACPTSSASYVLADQLGGDIPLAKAVVMLATMLSVFSYTLLLSCLPVFPTP